MMKVTNKQKIVCILIFLLSVQIIFAWETPRTLDELVRFSSLIVHGTVVNKYSVIENDGEKGNIFTYILLSISDTYAGKDDLDTLLIKMKGGKTEDRVSWTEELFRFDLKEEVLLFLSPINGNSNVFKIVSMSGKLTVIIKNNIRYYDTSTVRSDGEYLYGPGSITLIEDIRNRIVTIKNQ